MKALSKRLLDGVLRRLGLVRTAVAAAQTVDAIYLSQLGRAPDNLERAENAGAVRNGGLTISALIESLSESAEGRARLWDVALPEFVRAGYVAPSAHFEGLVEIAFLAVFGRRPEAQALAAYEGALRSRGLAIEAFVTELSSTQEAADRILSQGYLDKNGHLAQVVDIIFCGLLARPPEAEARAAYTEALRSERLSVEAFADELLRSPDATYRMIGVGYFDKISHLAHIVDAVFLAVLGRPPEAEARAAYVEALRSERLTTETFIGELSMTTEASERILKHDFKDYGYISKQDHFCVLADAISRSIFGRPLDEADQKVFAFDFMEGNLNIQSAVEQFMNSEEVKLRVRTVGLPDVLEGIYSTLKGAPETDPALGGLIRSAASQRTFETIKAMSISAEAFHYMMQPIIEAHRQQFLASPEINPA